MPGLRYKKYAESRRGRQNECCVSRLLSIVPTGTLIFNPDRALQTPVIRIAEGYWPWGFRRLRFNLIDTLDIRVNHWGEQLDELQDEIKEL